MRWLTLFLLLFLTALSQAGRKEALCLAQARRVPIWACSCKAWKSQFNRTEKCLQGELNTDDLDCDGLTNRIDPLPFIPYQTYEWTIVRPDFWRQYRIRYDETKRQFIVRLKLFFHFPDHFSAQRINEILELWKKTSEEYFSDETFKLQLILVSDRDEKLLSSQDFDYPIDISSDGGRSWALHWHLMSGNFLEKPHKTLLHELAHLMGLNDAYPEPDQKVLWLKLLFMHNPDPSDINDKESLMKDGLTLRPHHIYKILGNGSCQSLGPP